MPEAGGANIEIAQHPSEPKKGSRVETPRRTEIPENFEAIVLALVAVSTARSGYQAARWDGQQSLPYGRPEAIKAVQAAVTERTRRVFFNCATKIVAALLVFFR